MLCLSRLVACTFALCVVLPLPSFGAPQDAWWPQWRGPLCSGAAPDGNPPTVWSEQKHVKWRTALPGLGHSTPIVWDDRIFVTTAVETDRSADDATVKAAAASTPAFHRRQARMPQRIVQFIVMAIRRTDGNVLWSRVVCERVPDQATHGDGSWASGSPVTDGERVYAYFGSVGLYALTMDGEPVWQREFGTLKIKANFGGDTSPVLCGDLVILNQDHEKQSFVVALDKKTGDPRWRVNRDEATSWATPLVVEHAGKRQLVTSATRLIRGYDASTGALLWQVPGMTGNVIPSPVAADGMVVCMSGFRGSAALAIRLAEATGDLTSRPAAIAWRRDADTPYVPSPLLHEGYLYYVASNKGRLSCVTAATGQVAYETQPLSDIKLVYASPVGAGEHVYVTGRGGVTAVVRCGPVFALVASNRLDDQFTASPVVVGDTLYLRGHQRLYCIARP